MSVKLYTILLTAALMSVVSCSDGEDYETTSVSLEQQKEEVDIMLDTLSQNLEREGFSNEEITSILTETKLKLNGDSGSNVLNHSLDSVPVVGEVRHDNLDSVPSTVQLHSMDSQADAAVQNHSMDSQVVDIAVQNHSMNAGSSLNQKPMDAAVTAVKSVFFDLLKDKKKQEKALMTLAATMKEVTQK